VPEDAAIGEKGCLRLQNFQKTVKQAKKKGKKDSSRRKIEGKGGGGPNQKRLWGNGVWVGIFCGGVG